MDTALRPRARSLIAIALLLVLVAGSAAAAAQGQDQDRSRNDAGKGEREQTECRTDAPAGDEGSNVDIADEGGSGKSAKKSKKSDENECTPPPRCKGQQVDLAPEEDQPTCVDQSQLNRLLSDFEAAAAEEAQALRELTAALDKLDALNRELLDLRGRLRDIQLRLGAARADQGFAAIREGIAAESLDDVTSALQSEEEKLRSQAVEAYMGGDAVELATAAAVIELEGFSAQQTAREYASVVIGDQLATVDQVEALRGAVEDLRTAVDEIEQAARADADQVATIEAEVSSLIERQRTLVSEAEAEAEAVAEAIAEVQSRKAAYADELRIKGAGGGAIGELLRSRQADQTPPSDPTGILHMPLEHTRVGSPFGPRVHPIFKDSRLHAGVDLSGLSGDPILASGDGVVVIAEETSGYGNVVVIDHGNTLATLYAHMTADAVSVGQEVSQGDLVGFVGSTGYSTGPHLHFEVRVQGTPVDPLLYLRLK